MKIFEHEEFRRGAFADRDSAAVYEDLDFRHCYFESYFLSLTNNPKLRSTVRNVHLRDCSQRGCTLYAAILEDIVVDGLKTNDQLVRTHGAVFNRVELRGRIDRLMISNDMLPSALSTQAVRERDIAQFQHVNAEFYRHVDWALDISHGEFTELDIRGVPGSLIRRDPETQILVKRRRVLEADWRAFEFKTSLTAFVLDLLVKLDTPDKVLVAPKRHPQFHDYLDDLRLLQKAGVAEPD